MTRRSLRDRNRAAIALDPDATETPAEPTNTAPDKAQRVPEPKAQAAAPKPRPAAAAASSTGRLGIYLTPEEFDDAKAAYLADWTTGGEADTFARWIAAALDRYAARTPKQRAAHAQPRGRADERTGSTRSFSIPVDTLARMRAAITADQQAGRWPSDSAWCGEAITQAVGQARDRNDGHLPTPPPRLPNRLVR